MPNDDQNARSQEPSLTQDSGTVVAEEELIQQLSRLARALQAETDMEKLLDEVVSAGVALIPGADEGSISVVTARRNVASHSPSSDLPERVDALQEEVGEGPCLDAVFQEQTVRVPDLAHESRWPQFSRRAVEAGARSMLSFQLYVTGDNLGALNLYGRQPDAFDEESEHVGLLFAAHAAVAFAEAQKFDHLNQAVATRDLIGQAKGILMERYQITADQAFTVLVRASQQRNRKLRDLAAELVSRRQLPGLTARAASSEAAPPARRT